jgi:hypothetical protein
MKKRQAQFTIVSVLSSVVVAFTLLLDLYNPESFIRFFGSINPLIIY